MKFVNVRYWNWTHYGLGTQTLMTSETTTPEQMTAYLNRTQPHSGGNWDPRTLKCVVTKVKAKIALECVDVTAQRPQRTR